MEPSPSLKTGRICKGIPQWAGGLGPALQASPPLGTHSKASGTQGCLGPAGHPHPDPRVPGSRDGGLSRPGVCLSPGLLLSRTAHRCDLERSAPPLRRSWRWQPHLRSPPGPLEQQGRWWVRSWEIPAHFAGVRAGPLAAVSNAGKQPQQTAQTSTWCSSRTGLPRMAHPSPAVNTLHRQTASSGRALPGQAQDLEGEAAVKAELPKFPQAQEASEKSDAQRPACFTALQPHPHHCPERPHAQTPSACHLVGPNHLRLSLEQRHQIGLLKKTAGTAPLSSHAEAAKAGAGGPRVDFPLVPRGHGPTSLRNSWRRLTRQQEVEATAGQASACGAARVPLVDMRAAGRRQLPRWHHRRECPDELTFSKGSQRSAPEPLRPSASGLWASSVAPGRAQLLEPVSTVCPLGGIWEGLTCPGAFEVSALNSHVVPGAGGDPHHLPPSLPL